MFRKVKQLSAETVCIVALTLIWDIFVYFGPKVIAASWRHYDMTLPWDLKIPFLPWTVVIYIGSYIMWFLCYLFFAYQEPKSRNRFFCADLIGKTVCLLFFLLVPTTNVRPDVSGDGVWNWCMRALYAIDRPDNLFPSIHCMASWLFWACIRKNRELPAAMRWTVFASALVICVSTLTTRQHVMVDVFGGVATAELCYWLSGRKSISNAYDSAVRRLMRLLKKTV